MVTRLTTPPPAPLKRVRHVLKICCSDGRSGCSDQKSGNVSCVRRRKSTETRARRDGGRLQANSEFSATRSGLCSRMVKAYTLFRTADGRRYFFWAPSTIRLVSREDHRRCAEPRSSLKAIGGIAILSDGHVPQVSIKARFLRS
jgi:hypothetical protein